AARIRSGNHFREASACGNSGDHESARTSTKSYSSNRQTGWHRGSGHRVWLPSLSVHVLEGQMYTTFYGLREEPFRLTSDPRFFYLAEPHAAALATVVEAVMRRKGIVLLT